MRRYVIPAAVILIVMLLLPWLTVTFVQGMNGMAVCLILFYAVNPALAAGMGVWSGWRRQWYWPAAVAGTFLMGVWLLFAPGETAFLLYAGVYLVIGLAAMGVTCLIRKK